MSIYLKNLEFLKKTSPAFYQRATGDECRHPALQLLEEAHSLRLQLGECCCYLHSAYDLDREMRRLFERADNEEQTLIIFGLGMGYCLDYMVEHRLKYRAVHVIEPFNNIFQAMLSRRDLPALLARDNVFIHLFSNPQEMSQFLWSQIQYSTGIKLLSHLSYCSIFADFYAEAGRLFADKSNLIRSSIATENEFLASWTFNQLKSLKLLRPQADILYNKFPEIPAVIVSAGPSLERHFDLLNGIGDRALIIAPGTGARILDRRGIRAHLVMAVDSAELEADLFKNFKGTCPLVGSFRLHPRIDEEFPNPILRVATSSDLLAHYYYSYFKRENLTTVADHPSVSNCAIDYAVNLGCNPIILIGQDLCFYDQKSHADKEAGSVTADRPGYKTMLDINGQSVITNSAFQAIRSELESQNQQYKDRAKIINATEAGLGVPGVVNRRFIDVISDHIVPQQCDVAGMLASALSCSGRDGTGDPDIAGFYDHLLEQIDLLQRKIREKSALLIKLDKMQKRHLKLGRLNEQIALIKEKNAELEQNVFYKEVVLAGIGAIIQYHLLAVQSRYGLKDQFPDAFKASEEFIVNTTARYLDALKDMVHEEKKANS
jgi:hypothetical protein